MHDDEPGRPCVEHQRQVAPQPHKLGYQVWGLGSLERMDALQSACMTAMAQGMRARSTDSTSRGSHKIRLSRFRVWGS